VNKTPSKARTSQHSTALSQNNKNNNNNNNNNNNISTLDVKWNNLARMAFTNSEKNRYGNFCQFLMYDSKFYCQQQPFEIGICHWLKYL
jgi:protein tyrosine phosphatase